MNPWLTIPLQDYEAHMAMPDVGQAQLISEIFADSIRKYRPASLVLLGCAGGNGLERIQPGSPIQVVAIDINPDYIARARSRFSTVLPNAMFIPHDIEHAPIPAGPVDLVFAALLFEYVDVDSALSNLKPLFHPTSVLVSVFQMPAAGQAEITPTPYRSLRALDGRMRLVQPDRFAIQARKAGLETNSHRTVRSPAGKEFAILHCRTHDHDSGAAAA